MNKTSPVTLCKSSIRRMLQHSKKIIPTIFFLLLIFTIPTYPKLFVNPTIGDGWATLLKKLGDTLDEHRWSTGYIISDGKTISQPGLYVLSRDIPDEIIINANDVWLDLNGYKIEATTTSNHGIIINDNKKNILIKNGSLKGYGTENSTASGIEVNGGTCLVKIENIHISEFQTGIHIKGNAESTIKSCHIKDCTFTQNKKAMRGESLIKSVFEGCIATNSVLTGFELIDGQHNTFYRCKALKTKNNLSDERAIAFASTSGACNVFIECVANGTEKTSSNFNKHAIGFLFNGTETTIGEQKSEIINCIVNGTNTSGQGNAIGIYLEPLIKSSNPLASAVVVEDFSTDEILDVAWSNEANFIAICGLDNNLKILQFDGTNLIELTSKSLSRDLYATAFSPRGEFIAVGRTKGSGSELYVYRFDPNAPSSNMLTDEISVNIGATVNTIKWSKCGRYIIIGTTNDSIDEIQILGFSGSALTPIYSVNPNKTVGEISISHDDKYIAAAYETTTNNIEVFLFDPFATNPLDSKTVTTSFSQDNLKSIDWSPIACNATYFLAVGGETNNDTNIEILTFNETSLITTETANNGADVEKIVWSPNGTHILISRDTDGSPGDEVEIFEFNNSTIGQKLISIGTGELPGGDSHSGAWSPNGQYVVAVGCVNPGDIAIFDVAHIPSKCTIKYNEVCNTIGGLCGIGILGSSAENLIIKNIGYENNINFSSGIFNQFVGGLNGTPSFLENLSIPPYED